MKIRRKSTKLARHARPLYIIGYSAPPPHLAEVRTWFDLEYGGPLTLKEDHVGSSALVLAGHGPWNAAFQLSLPLKRPPHGRSGFTGDIPRPGWCSQPRHQQAGRSTRSCTPRVWPEA